MRRREASCPGDGAGRRFLRRDGAERVEMASRAVVVLACARTERSQAQGENMPANDIASIRTHKKALYVLLGLGLVCTAVALVPETTAFAPCGVREYGPDGL